MIRSDSIDFRVIRASLNKNVVFKTVVSACSRVIRVTPTLYIIKLKKESGGWRTGQPKGKGQRWGTGGF